MFKYLIPLLFLIGCSENHPSTSTRTQFTGNAMTIDYKIIIGKQLPFPEVERVEKIIDTIFAEIHEKYNKYNPESEVSRLNRLKAHVVVPISAQLEHFLKETENIVFLSEGRFDPTIEPLQALWKKNLENGNIPPENEIETISAAIGWDHIHIDNGTFYKDHDLTSLDLGGIAKGLCVDLLVENLNSAGFPDVFVEWGGEIRASGKHPEGRSWKIFISNLGDSNPDHAIATISLSNQAIATSGDYLQNWTIQMPNEQIVTYFHIIDPRTLQPLIIHPETVASVSVLAPTCALADALATTALLFPSKLEAEAWAEKLKIKNPSLTFWIISRS